MSAMNRAMGVESSGTSALELGSVNDSVGHLEGTPAILVRLFLRTRSIKGLPGETAGATGNGAASQKRRHTHTLGKFSTALQVSGGSG